MSGIAYGPGIWHGWMFWIPEMCPKLFTTMIFKLGHLKICGLQVLANLVILGVEPCISKWRSLKNTDLQLYDIKTFLKFSPFLIDCYGVYDWDQFLPLPLHYSHTKEGSFLAMGMRMAPTDNTSHFHETGWESRWYRGNTGDFSQPSLGLPLGIDNRVNQGLAKPILCDIEGNQVARRLEERKCNQDVRYCVN